MTLAAIIICSVLAVVGVVSLVFAWVAYFRVSKIIDRLEVLELHTVRSVMEENPKTVDFVLEAQRKLILNGFYSDPRYALKEARRMYGLPP